MQENQNDVLTDQLKRLGIQALNSMQETAISQIGEAVDTIILSPTGSGKTFAFMLGMISRMDSATKGLQAVMVAPSRELVIQLEQVFRSLRTAYRVVSCYGGHPMKTEENALREGPALMITTPGRLVEHLDRATFSPESITMVVLDEFDKILQLGFHDQLRLIFNALPENPQLILTSATTVNTFPEFLPLHNPETIDFLDEESSNPNLTLNVVHTSSVEKVQSLLRLVSGFNGEVCLVFCNHIEAVKRISDHLHQHNVEHGVLHGDLEQIDREKNLIRFRGGAHNVLIATDLVARGLDIPEIRHIVHYQAPPTEKAFIHRNGRTARMHASGDAYLILAKDESLPNYLVGSVADHELPVKFTLPPKPEYTCLYISAGKKQKISKGDVAGFLMKTGGVAKEDVGLITILDHASFACVKRSVAGDVLRKVKHVKLKKVAVKVEEAW